MKTLPPLLLLVLLGVRALAADLASITTKELPSLVALYKEIHAHPELSLHEKETAARIAEELRQAGLEVTTGVGGTGVVGVLRNGPGPTVLLRTELDAPLSNGHVPEALVLNTTGELKAVYPKATLAFIGKSLRARGGQNFIEAARVLPTVARAALMRRWS